MSAITRLMSVLAVATAVTTFAPAAQAQPPTSSAPSQDDIDFLVAPPPLDPNYPLPTDDGQPDRDYQPGPPCVSAGPSQVLEQKPWGQDVLRFDEIERFGLTGRTQKVAVIDTGVHPHNFLGDRLKGGGDYVARGGDGLEDCDGHGTEVAGIIAANPNNPDIGFRGIAPQAKILSIRQSSANYEFTNPTTNKKEGAGSLTTLAKAIMRAAADPEVTVINMSVDNCRLTSAGPIREEEKQVQAALRYAVEERNIVPVASAGNINDQTPCKEQNSPDPNHPSLVVIPPWFSEYVLSVGAMTENGDPAEFSIQGPWVSVAAPGTEIISLDPVDPTALANRTFIEGKELRIEGTSFAAPYVAGLAALVRERFKDLPAKAVMHRIKTTAAHPAADGGHNSQVGHGMVNPIAALTAMIPAEEGIPADQAVDVPFEMPPPYERDWTPMRVAMIGSGGGLGLLLLTLFVVHTVRRNR